MAEASKRVALVTGGSRGVGYGIAQALAAEGWNLVIVGRRSADDVATNLDALRETGSDVLYCRMDMADLEAHAPMLAQVRERFGGLHLLVNNAGVAPKQRLDVLEATVESYDWVMGVNLRGPYFLMQAAARWMVEQRQADPDCCCCIINVSSISATVASPSRGEYCLSKAALSMATQLWAVRLGEFGIPVYEVRPGITLTDMTAGVKEKYDKLLAEGLCVQPRWGLPDDVGRAVAMLGRGDLAYSTGQVLMVDGGLTLPRL